MSGSTKHQDAADDRELERIMAMTEEDFLREYGREKFDAMVEASRKLFEQAAAEAGLWPRPDKH